MIKFERIIGPADDYHGPASGLGTEHGDSWREALRKFNVAIDAIETYINGNASGNASGNADGLPKDDIEPRLGKVETEVAGLKDWLFGEDTPPVTTAENTPTEVNMGGAPVPAVTSDPAFESAAANPAPVADAPAALDPNGNPPTGGSPMPGNYTAADTRVGDAPAPDATPVDQPPVVMGSAPTSTTPAGEPVPPTALVDNPAVEGSLASAAQGGGQIIGDTHMPDEVLTNGQPENRDEFVQTADGEYHPIEPTADQSGIVMTGAEGKSNPAPQPQGQPVDDPIDPEPIASFNGEPGIVVGSTRDENSDDNRFVASGASGQVVAEQPAEQLQQKPGQVGEARPDNEPASPLAVLADKEQALQAAQEQNAANTMKPDVDPEQAVDNPATPPSGATLDRADAGALNNVRKF